MGEATEHDAATASIVRYNEESSVNVAREAMQELKVFATFVVHQEPHCLMMRQKNKQDGG